MKIGYFDLLGGAAGDMILGSLIDAGLAVDSLKKELSALPFTGWRIDISKVKRGGITATHVTVKTRDQSPPRTLKDITKILNAGRLPKPDIEAAARIFRRLAKIEAKIHGSKINKVHFHEVGGIDAIIDIVGAVCGLRLMNIEKIIVSPFPIGLQPAPATAELLKDFLVYGISENKETVTPTAAAILTTLASSEKLIPAAKIVSVGYGAGTEEFKTRPNLLRLMVCKHEENSNKTELLTLLETNIDDANPQVYDFVSQRLFNGGALDVWLTPILMKKNRPAVTLSILCQLSQEHAMMEILFQEGLTLGIRRRLTDRISLPRRIITVNTKFGKVRIKIGLYKRRIVRTAPEYEDCKKIAREKGIPFGRVITEIQKQLSVSKNSNVERILAA